MSKNTKETITLGSGKLYMSEFNGETIPEIDSVCIESNRIGWIKGGASIEYTPTTQEVKDDLGMVSKVITTEEEAILKSGIMTWNGDTLDRLCDTARVSEDNAHIRRTVKIGGIGNSKNKNYVIVFAYADSVDGNKWVRIVGRNKAGLTIKFAKEDATVIDAEFKAIPGLDDVGTLIEFIEEIG